MQRTNASVLPPERIYSKLLRPTRRTRWQGVKDFFYDKRYGTCLTRTPVNWFAISVYYAAFLLGVFLIFYISMLVTEAVAKTRGNEPQYVLGDSAIGSSPALNFFPSKKSKNFLLLKKPSDQNVEYVDMINKEFDKYYDESGEFDPDIFEDCAEPPYGYNDSSPCIYIRINRLIQWKPVPYRSKDRLPKDMPQDMVKWIKNSIEPKVWISCHGTTASDRDHLTNVELKFQGEPGFNASVFPYAKGTSFLDPIIAIKLKSTLHKVIVSVTCEAWAKQLNRKKAKVDLVFYFE